MYYDPDNWHILEALGLENPDPAYQEMKMRNTLLQRLIGKKKRTQNQILPKK